MQDAKRTETLSTKQMTFNEWLDGLMTELALTNAAVARYGRLDPSTISRYRAGTRIPLPDCKALRQLVTGLYEAVKAENMTAQLSSHISGSSDRPLFERLLAAATKHAERHSTPTEFDERCHDTFSDRFDRIMRHLGLSNIQLARKVNLDSSLISRWRTGARLPKKDNPSLVATAVYLWQLLTQKSSARKDPKRGALLSEIDRHNTEALTGTEPLLHYLTDGGDHKDKLNQTVDAILEKISRWQGAGTMPSIEVQPTEEPRLEARSLYQGIHGLREAVVRFLSDVAYSTTPRQLKLFSNQSMTWLTADPAFTKQWATLMGMVLARGHKIEIIHHLGRSVVELTDAIEKWLPLYMMGSISPYTCTELNLPSARSIPLVKTIFLDKGHSVISGELVQGTEDEAYYRFLTDERSLNAFEKQFEQLMRHSTSLITTERQADAISRQITSSLDAYTNDRSLNKKEITDLSPVYPLYLVSDSILTKLLYANRLTTADMALVRQKHRALRLRVDAFLKTGVLSVISPLDRMRQRDEPPQVDLFGLPLPSLTFSPDLFGEQIERLGRRLQTERNLRVRSIKWAPFDDLRMISLRERRILIEKRDAPSLLLEAHDETFCRCLNDYVERIRETSEPFLDLD